MLGLRFQDLLTELARRFPDIRIRFTSPHPKDFPDPILEIIAENANLCNQIHLPAQSGSNKILESMNRKYSRESYLNLVHRIRDKIPGVALSSDFITGFCGETEQDFQDTLDLIKEVKYDSGFLFAYSMREKTFAHRKLVDDVPEEVKARRLSTMIEVFNEQMFQKLQERQKKKEIALVYGKGKKPGQVKAFCGRFR